MATARHGDAPVDDHARAPSECGHFGAACGHDEQAVPVAQQQERPAVPWKFCWLAGGGTGVERTARVLREMAAEGELGSTV